MNNPDEQIAFDQTRLDKVRALHEQGMAPYPHMFDRRDTIQEIRARVPHQTGGDHHLGR